MNLAPVLPSKYQYLKAANEPLVEELHDPHYRELPKHIRESLPPIVIQDQYHRVAAKDTVILIPSFD